MASLRQMSLFCTFSFAIVSLSSAKASGGGSKACPHTGFFGKKVVPLCEKHFPDDTAKNAWVIQFYHAYVKENQAVKGVYEELAVAKDLKGTKVGAVDCQHNGEFCAKHGIRKVPTTRVLHQGNSREFEGSYTLDALKSFLQTSLKGFKEMEEALNCKVKGIFTDPKKDTAQPLCVGDSFPPSTENHPWLISFYESGDRNKDKTMKGTMNKLADKFGNAPPKKPELKKKPTKIRVGAVDCSEQKGCSELGITSFPTVRFYQKAADPIDFDSFFDREEVQKWADARFKAMPKEAPAPILNVEVPEGEADAKKEEL